MTAVLDVRATFDSLRARCLAGDATATFAMGRLARALSARLRAYHSSLPDYGVLARLYVEIGYDLAQVHHAAGHDKSALYWVEQMYATTQALSRVGLGDDDLRALTLTMYSLVLDAQGSAKRAALMADQARSLLVTPTTRARIDGHLVHISTLEHIARRGDAGQQSTTKRLIRPSCGDIALDR